MDEIFKQNELTLIDITENTHINTRNIEKNAELDFFVAKGINIEKIKIKDKIGNSDHKAIMIKINRKNTRNFKYKYQ